MNIRTIAAITALPLALVVAACGGNGGYQDTGTLQSAIKGIVTSRLDNPSGPFYLPGVHVTGVICVKQSATTANCVTSMSNGATAPSDVVISADGSSFVTK
jgi:hypothetical protein